MSYYAVYYHPPTSMVYPPPPQPPTTQHPNPFIQPTALQSCVPSTTPSQSQCIGPHGKCEPVSKGCTAEPAVKRKGHAIADEQLQSPLLRLPAELRNQIYGYLLCPDTSSLSALKSKKNDLAVRGFNETSTSIQLYPGILSTCRKIHGEAHSLLYTTHIFHAHPSLLASLPHLASKSRPVLYPSVTGKIRRWQISLRLDTDPRFTAQQARAAFSGAEYLEIRVWQAQFEACNWDVLKLFLGVRGVQVARVGGSVDLELSEWLEKVMMGAEDMKSGKQGCGEPGCDCRDGDVMLNKFQGKKELVCGRCYGKVNVLETEGSEAEWDLWRFAAP